jgi:hypothetical protein
MIFYPEPSKFPAIRPCSFLDEANKLLLIANLRLNQLACCCDLTIDTLVANQCRDSLEAPVLPVHIVRHLPPNSRKQMPKRADPYSFKD